MRAGSLVTTSKGLPPELRCEPLEVAAEDRAQHDFERELAHVVGDVDGLAARGLRFPARDEPLVGLVDHSRNSVMTRRWNMGCIM